MTKYTNQNGFTMFEILIALMIMAIGFLAMAQMQYLSLRQQQLAEEGTVATNMIQFIADRDISEVKRQHLLNSTAYVDAQAGRVPDFSYCDGTGLSSCTNPPACPCNPLEAITPNPNNGISETTCAAINTKNFDTKVVNFKTTETQCEADGNNIITNDKTEPLYVVKQATTIQAQDPISGLQILTVTTTYAVKTTTQFQDTGLSTVSIKDSLASQSFEVTAHLDNWNNFIPGAGWATVSVPHVP